MPPRKPQFPRRGPQSKNTPRPAEKRQNTANSRPRLSPGPRPATGPRPGAGPRRSPDLLYGRHAVRAALANPRRQNRHLWLSPYAATTLTPDPALPQTILEPSALERLLPHDTVHQGFILQSDPLPEPDPGLLKITPRLILLDQVSDPRNIGAILRSAAVFGAGAVVITRRNAPQQSGAMAKAASGALEAIALLRVANLARTLRQLKDDGVTVIGLDSDADGPLSAADCTGRTALVLGAEGAGLRRLTREHCDHLAHLSAPGLPFDLNVSNAAAVALYEIFRQNGPALA